MPKNHHKCSKNGQFLKLKFLGFFLPKLENTIFKSNYNLCHSF
jgi:hypothetical protein